MGCVSIKGQRNGRSPRIDTGKPIQVRAHAAGESHRQALGTVLGYWETVASDADTIVLGLPRVREDVEKKGPAKKKKHSGRSPQVLSLKIS